MTDTERLLHLADRARRGVLLFAERDALTAGITAMGTRMAELEAEIVDTRKTVKYFDRQSKRRNVRITELETKAVRYRTAWTSARRRAAMYLKSNENFAASLDNSHAAYLQLAAGSVLPGDKRTCCGARIGHFPGCPANQPPADDYEQMTGHEITCCAGFTDTCTCDTSQPQTATT